MCDKWERLDLMGSHQFLLDICDKWERLDFFDAADRKDRKLEEDGVVDRLVHETACSLDRFRHFVHMARFDPSNVVLEGVDTNPRTRRPALRQLRLRLQRLLQRRR